MRRRQWWVVGDAARRHAVPRRPSGTAASLMSGPNTLPIRARSTALPGTSLVTAR
jgi:hypothetical protein